MFFKANKKGIVNEDKVVYIFKFQLRRNDDIFKVGITSREDVTTRLGEILIAFFNKHRYIPNTSIRRFSRCENAEDAEKQLLSRFEQVNFINKFNGYSEFVYADEEELLEAYDEIVKGKA
jgi:hypothetical protein